MTQPCKPLKPIDSYLVNPQQTPSSCSLASPTLIWHQTLL